MCQMDAHHRVRVLFAQGIRVQGKAIFKSIGACQEKVHASKHGCNQVDARKVTSAIWANPREYSQERENFSLRRVAEKEFDNAEDSCYFLREKHVLWALWDHNSIDNCKRFIDWKFDIHNRAVLVQDSRLAYSKEISHITWPTDRLNSHGVPLGKLRSDCFRNWYTKMQLMIDMCIHQQSTS